MRNFIKYTGRMVIFILAQVYVLNQIPTLHAYITPSIYFLFIVWLPFTISRGTLLLVSFITGLLLDFFMKTRFTCSSLRADRVSASLFH